MQQLTEGTMRRNKRTGEVQVLQGGQWVSRGGGSAMPSVIEGDPKTPSPQTPAQAQSDQLTVADKSYEVQTKPVFDRANAIDKVRDGYRQDKRILQYEQAIPIYISALHSPEDAAGDNMLVNAAAKVGDPSTGVQQREGESWEGTQAQLDQAKANMLKQFGTDGYGNFTPEARRKIREAITGRMRAIADQYRFTRKEYENYIRTLNLPNVDPESVIGPNAGIPFQRQEGQYLGREPGLNVPVGPDGKTQRLGGPGDIGFAGADPTPPGMTPQQEAAYNAFFAANPQATPQQLEQFAAAMGITLHNAQQIIEARNAGAGVRPGADAVVKAPDISDVRKGDEVMDPILRGTADIITMGGSEELAAVPRALSTGVSYDEALAYENAVRDYDKEHNFGKRLGGQLGGGLVLPMFGARSVPQIAGVAGGYGAGYGFGSADGGMGERSLNALMGGAAGAATGAALAGGANAARKGLVVAGRRIAGPTSPEQNALLRAADEEQVPLNIGDVYPGAQNTVSTMETIPGASGPVRAGIAAGRDAIEGRVGALSRGGSPRENMGEAVQDAGRRFVKKADDQADVLYKRARNLAGGTPITPNVSKTVTQALKKAEDEVPGGTKAGAVIQRYAEALESGKPITIDGARAMRSELLSALRTDGGLSKSKATHITNKIMRAVNQDIEAGLTAAGRGGAVRAYRDADKFYAETREEIDRVTEKFIGTEASPKSAEQTITAMRNAANPRGGDARSLAGMLRRLSPEERKDYAATLVEHLGRKSPEEPFSPQTFITQIRALSPQARRVIFGADGEKSIQNLITISNAKNASVQRLNNSRSGQVINYRSVLSNIIFGIPGGAAIAGAAGGAVGAVGTAAGASLSVLGVAGARALAKAFMNDEFTRAIARAPATSSPRAINAHIGMLRKVASKDPNVRSVVESMERQLAQFANDNVRTVSRSAASDGSDPERD